MFISNSKYKLEPLAMYVRDSGRKLGCFWRRINYNCLYIGPFFVVAGPFLSACGNVIYDLTLFFACQFFVW